MRLLASLSLSLLIGTALLITPAAAEQGATMPQPRDYRIGIEDVLRIVVWGEPELTLAAKVRPDGKITVPLINDVEVVGITALEVRDRVAEGLAKFVRDPNVTVIVEEINSFRVYMLGEVSEQGALQLFRPTRVLQAIAMAGGLSEFSKKKITLLRQTGGREARIDIDYKQLINGDPAQENLFLMPGDTLLCD